MLGEKRWCPEGMGIAQRGAQRSWMRIKSSGEDVALEEMKESGMSGNSFTDKMPVCWLTGADLDAHGPAYGGR